MLLYVWNTKMFLRIATFIIFTLFLSCTTNKSNKPESILINNRNEVQPIDIRAPKFFYMLRPWKEGKLLTLDGWARYAEISFKDENRIQIKPLFNFPRTYAESWQFDTWPEAGLITNGFRMWQNLASVDDGITKSHVPLLTWRHTGPSIVLLDPNVGLIAYQYIEPEGTGIRLFIYNYKTDTMIYEEPEPSVKSPQNNIYMQFRIDKEYIFSHISTHKKTGGPEHDTFFYDWKKGEITRNELTEFLSKNNIYVYDNCVHLGRRYLFANVKGREREDTNKLLKIDWDDEYSNIQVTDMSYLFQSVYKKKEYNISDLNITISSDGSWVTATITDFSEYTMNGPSYVWPTTRVFFHMDNKYPNGISMPIFSDGNETRANTNNDDGAFVQHPVYGMCYAQEWHSGGKIYLRLYKMDDVLTVINSGSQSVPFNYDDSKNYLYTREYSYYKKLILDWVFDENDTAAGTNLAIDSIIKYCEAEIGQTPVSEPDNQLCRVELYKDNRTVYRIPSKKARVCLYINKSNEDDNIYYIEIDFFILRNNYNQDLFIKHKIIICNQYFNFSESGNEVPKEIFWEFYDLVEEDESAFNFFLKEMEKHRR